MAKPARITPEIQAAAELANRRAAHMLRCYDDFAYFVKSFWHVIEPDTPLIWGWWLDMICSAVQRQQEGDPAYRWLLVMQPPGTAKSRVMSVMKPAWVWLRNPSKRMLYISTAEKVAERDSKYTRDVLRSSGWEDDLDYPDMIRCGYRDVVRFLHDSGKSPGVVRGHRLHRYPLWDFEKDQDEKGNFANTRKGVRLCSPMGGDVTGLRGDDVTVDDPVSFKEIENFPPSVIATHMRNADTKARYVYTTRVNDRDYSTRTMVMQRFDPDDPAGTALRDGQWKVICVPMEHDPEHPLKEHMKDDPRTEAGEVLVGFTIDPRTGRERPRALQTAITRAQAIRDLGIIQYEAQYNQKPKRASGDFVTAADVANLDRYEEPAIDVANRADEVMLTADFTFDDTAGSDKVVIQAWAREGPARFTLLDRIGRQMNYPTMKREMRNMKERWPMARRIRIEKAAAGPMIIADLESEIPGMIAVPTGRKSKWERAKVALQPLIQGRNIVLPRGENAPWVEEVIASWVHMRPGGKDDDDVDAAALMGAQWGLGGNIDPMWIPASKRLDLVAGDLQEDGEWTPPALDRKYLLCAGPNQAEGQPCAWSMFDLTDRREVAAWSGTADPQEWAVQLADVGRRYGAATIVVSSHAPATVAALLRMHYPKMWQDADDTTAHPGWWRTMPEMERVTHTLARAVTEDKMTVCSREGRAQLVGWDGDPGSQPWLATARVWPYLIAADMMDRLGAFRAKVFRASMRDESGAVRISYLAREKVSRSAF